MRSSRAWMVLLALCVVHASQAAQYQQQLAANPAFPGQCYEPVLMKAFAVNTSITDHESCTHLTCYRDGKDSFLIVGSSCASPREWPENCVLTTPDLQLDHPFCCPQIECDGEPEGPLSAVGK